MSHVSDLIATDIHEFLQRHEKKSLLRFITCGSVDDGKSTVIGRLLYESKMVLDDQLAAVEADSRKWGTQGGEIDFALLVDGLAAEREQGITIDVAYRSPRMPWYEGPTLMAFLETAEIDETRAQAGPQRLPVQWVNRPSLDFRGFCGLIASGRLRPGDRIRVQPAGRESRVARIAALEGDRTLAGSSTPCGGAVPFPERQGRMPRQRKSARRTCGRPRTLPRRVPPALTPR